MKNKKVQTKFPVARIKKIMQKDEDVGKVAQATPIVISKALELFLGLIVTESCSVTKQRGAKKVEAYHLKHAVETTDTLDFLKELVAGTADPSQGGTIDLGAAQAEAASKKRKPRAKKEKTAPDSDVPKRKRKKKAATPDESKMEVSKAESDVEPEEYPRWRQQTTDEEEDDAWE